MDTMRLKVELEAINKASGPIRDMLKGTTALSKGVKEAQHKLRELNAQQKQLEGFREASARVTETGKAMQEAGRKVRELRDALVASETPTQNMKKEYQAAARELRNLTSAHERAKTAQTAAAIVRERSAMSSSVQDSGWSFRIDLFRTSRLKASIRLRLPFPG